MWFGVLGVLDIRHEGTVIGISAGKQRAVLAALLVRANRVVSFGELADTVWDGAPAAGARTTTRNYIKVLRQALGPVAGARIITRDPGYLIQLDDGELDLLRFTRLCQEGDAAVRAGAWRRASDVLREGLQLWRGAPFADIPCPLLHRDEVPGLEQLRLQAIEWRVEADLHLGHHGRLVPELQAIASEYPLRESFHAQLMLALARSGRRAEALAAYQQARRILVGELGVEPTAELQHLQQQVLAGEVEPASDPDVPPSALGGDQDIAGTRSEPVVPHQLPAGLRCFVGRAAELDLLSSWLEDAGDPGETALVAVVSGTAGVGKTALAAHWAQQIADRFPDGQLYANLRGFDASARPTDPAEVLGGFLGALQTPAGQLPASLEAQAGLYRSLLAGRRMLIVLDNALEESQVRPLLPGAPGCLVIVASRHRLAGLVVAEGARAVTLDLLTQSEARDLLAGRLGADRAAAEPQALTELTGLCARLPLALAVLAARAASQPGFPLAELAAELRDAGGRLDALATGDPASSLRAVLSWSYQALEGSEARMFRLLGLHPGPDITVPAAASLLGAAPDRARELLRCLTRAHLLTEDVPGRYTFHDLLRAYAAEQATACESPGEQGVALTSLLDYSLATAAAAMDSLVPAEKHRRPAITSRAAVAPASTPAAARAWLDAERATLVALISHAAGRWPGHVTRLAAVLFRYLEIGGHHAEARIVHTHAIQAARQTADHAAEASALVNLAGVDWWQDRYEDAATRLAPALAIFAETGDRAGQARTLDNLGLVLWRQGSYEQAAARHRQALAIFTEIGDLSGQARTLDNLGLVLWRQGSYEQAATRHRQALAIFTEIGDRDGEADALDNLGVVLCRQGRHQEAAHHHQQAMAIYREIGDRDGQAEALVNLGIVLGRQGRHQEAATCHKDALVLCREAGNRLGQARSLNSLGVVLCQQGCYQEAAGLHRQALAIFGEIGDRGGEAETLNGAGETLDAAGLAGQAREHHRKALSIATKIGDRYQEARAHNGLARIRHAADTGQAIYHREQALRIYASLGVPAPALIPIKRQESGLQ